jgi:hypothetical protein
VVIGVRSAVGEDVVAGVVIVVVGAGEVGDVVIVVVGVAVVGLEVTSGVMFCRVTDDMGVGTVETCPVDCKMSDPVD